MELPNFRHIPGTRLYRSSRPDSVSGSSLEIFLSYEFRSIIDLRSMREFPSTSKSQCIDKHYKVLDVRINNSGSVQIRHLDQNRKVTDIRCCSLAQYDSAVLANTGEGRHFVFDLLSMEYVHAVMGRTSWSTRSMLYALYPVDYFFGTHWFLKGLVRHAINAHGILGQYKDIIDHCGQKIRVVLQTLSSRDNWPALVVCAYGKDRTGIIVALVLSVLGWSPEDIAADYSKSAAELEKAGAQVFGYLQQLNLSQSFYTSEHSTMIDLLNYISERYGSVEDYLTRLGFDSVCQDKLRSALIDSESAPSVPAAAAADIASPCPNHSSPDA